MGRLSRVVLAVFLASGVRVDAAPEEPSRLADCLALHPTMASILQKHRGFAHDLYNGLEPYLQEYHLCLAIGARDPALCQRLEYAAVNTTGVPLYSLCLEEYYLTLFARALILKSPEAATLCLQAADNFVGHLRCGPGGHVMDSEGDAPEDASVRSTLNYDLRQCGLILENNGNPLQTAHRIAKVCPAQGMGMGRDLGKLAEWLLIFGKAPMDEECGGSTEEVRRACRRYADFRRAAAARDPEKCGDNGVCRSMMGEPARFCGVYEWRFRVSYCSRVLEKSQASPLPQ